MCIPLQAFYSIRKSFTFYQASHEIWSTSGTAAPGRQKYTASAWRCATTCARRYPHLSLAELLHTHPPPRPPESHRARGPMPAFPRDWLERCPGSLPGVYPHVWSHAGCARAVGIPHAMFPQSLCVHTQPRQRPHAPSSPQGEDQPPPWTTEPQLLLGPCPAPSRFSPQGDLSSAGERDGVPPLADRTVSQESVGLSPLGMSRDLGSHRDPSRQPLAQRQPQPSLPFLPSKRSRQFSLPKYTTWACRCKKRLQALGMNFTKKACFWETDKFGGVLLSSAATAQYVPLLNVQCAGSS